MALLTDKLRKGAPNFITTLAGDVAVGDTSLTLQSATGLPTDTAVDFVLNRIDSDGNELDPALTEVITGTVAGNIVSTDAARRGRDGTNVQTHASGSVVEVIFTSAQWNDKIDAFMAGHNQDGTHKANTVNSASLNDGSVTTAKLAENSVSTAKLQNNSITPDKLKLEPQTDHIATSQSTTTTSWTDLATVGPQVTVNIGQSGKALVSVYGAIVASVSGSRSQMSFAVSGATTVAANDSMSLTNRQTFDARIGATFLVTGLNPGANTFTAKYQSQSGNTASFVDRRITVLPIG